MVGLQVCLHFTVTTCFNSICVNVTTDLREKNTIKYDKEATLYEMPFQNLYIERNTST